MSKYTELFKDPRWQKKRLKVLERDDYACQACYDPDSTLHVHHKYYEKGKKPWEYPDEALITLCEDCHEAEKINMEIACAKLAKAAKKAFLSQGVLAVANGLDCLKCWQAQEIIAGIIGWAINDPETQQVMTGGYNKWLKKTYKRKPKK